MHDADAKFVTIDFCFTSDWFGDWHDFVANG